MFICLDGIMGSGKTYFAVDYIHKKHDDYYKVFTNIGNYKFHDNVSSLNFKEFLNFIEHANIIYEDTGRDDDVLEYLKTIGLYNDDKKSILLVIDEAHNFFDKKSDVLTWFITYHRHLFIDAILITQTYSLIHTSYYKLFEYYLHAVPSSLRLSFSKSFKYKKYFSVPFNSDTFVNSLSLKVKDAIFKLYQSGDKVRVKSFARFYLYLFIFGFFVVVVFFYSFIKFFFGSSESVEQNVSKAQLNQSHNLSKTQSNNVVSYSNYKYITFVCDEFDCSNSSYDIKISRPDLISLIKISSSKQISNLKIYDNFFKLNFLVSPSFLSYFKEQQNGKKNIDILPDISFGSN